MKNKRRLYGIVKGIFTTFLVIVLAVVLVQKLSNNNLTIGGVRMFTIVSDSMKPTYKIGDIIFDKEVVAKDIKVGDHVTYLGTAGNFAGLVVTHEVMSIREENNTYYFITKGSANDIADPEITGADIYGKVIYKPFFLSFISGLMTNSIVYYGMFIVIGIFFSYQVITSFINKDDEDDSADDEMGNTQESN